MFKLLWALSTLGCIHYSQAQVMSLGSCPEVKVQESLDLTQYMGRWYEMERYFAIFEFGQKCGTAEYELKEGGLVRVNNTGFNVIHKSFTTAIGDAEVEDPSVQSKLGVRFSSNSPRGRYWVLSTDYHTHSVVWSCDDVGQLGLFNTQFLWILSRTPEGLPAQMKADIYSMLDNYSINTSKLRDAGQTNCPGR